MIGIITFHGSHNHGSMLQAYATQQVLLRLGYESEIINFRMKSQKEYYSLYQTRCGFMRFFRNLLQLPLHFDRKKRADKFEGFLSKRYLLSGKELSTYTDLKTIADKYDIYLSGSDQIWSDLIPEFINSNVDYTGVYFLDFVSNNKPKISYASSIGEASIEALEKKKNLLMQYSFISTREKKGRDFLKELLNRDIEVVPDPTLLLNGSEWRKISGKRIIKDKYIFLYTLRGIRPGLKWAKHLTKLGRKLGYRVVCVSPFFPVLYPGVKCLVNVGPEDFINLIDNAACVFTDSFHGTAFSVNLYRPIFSLTMKSSKDVRKTNLLRSVGLESRVLSSFEQIDDITNIDLDYSRVEKNLDELRLIGYTYLKNIELQRLIHLFGLQSIGG